MRPVNTNVKPEVTACNEARNEITTPVWSTRQPFALTYLDACHIIGLSSLVINLYIHTLLKSLYVHIKYINNKTFNSSSKYTFYICIFYYWKKYIILRQMIVNRHSRLFKFIKCIMIHNKTKTEEYIQEWILLFKENSFWLNMFGLYPRVQASSRLSMMSSVMFGENKGKME